MTQRRGYPIQKRAARTVLSLLMMTGGMPWVESFSVQQVINSRGRGTVDNGGSGGDFSRLTRVASSRRDNSNDVFDMESLQERLTSMRRNMMEEEFRMPPNPKLDAKEFITQVLRALYHYDDPLPDSGFRTFLRVATPSWRERIYDSIGARRKRFTPPQRGGAIHDSGSNSGSGTTTNPGRTSATTITSTVATDEDLIASAIGQALTRSNNQYGILVGEGDQQYTVSFPSDLVDYGEDSSCWLECHLRDRNTDQLLAILGWQLQRRESDGAWLVDHIDWQDFRDDFRPGIGREEWMRICG